MRKDKNGKKQDRKLVLKKESLRKLAVLSHDQLNQVAGGEPPHTTTLHCG